MQEEGKWGKLRLTEGIMKKIMLGLLMCCMTGSLAVAETSWLTSLPEAQALAKKEHKLVLMDFTGSDWCPGCIALEKEVLSKPEFLEYAKKNLVLVQVDFPVQKKQSAELKKANDDLQARYKIDGFPTLVALNPDGKIVWQTIGYPGGGPSAVLPDLDKARKKNESGS